MNTGFVALHVSKFFETPDFLLKLELEIHYNSGNITHKTLFCKLLTSIIKTLQFLWWTHQFHWF